MKGRTTMIRPAPWPLYDTEKVARWLEKMARQGFVLTEHGFPGTLPLAIFQKTNRQNLRYCLVGTVSNVYAPEQETIAWNEARGWTYVARYGDYYVYRSEEAADRGLGDGPGSAGYLDESVGHCRVHHWAYPFPDAHGYRFFPA